MFLVFILVIISFFTGYLFFRVQSLEKNQTAGVAKQQQPAETQPNVKVNIKDVSVEGEPYIGDPDAPITMAYWLDFQCPFCQKFETDTLPTLIKNYVETGKLKIVFKDFQFLGDDSQTAGLVANAVWEIAPKSYQAWHEAMYKNQDDENGGWGKKEDIIAMTRTISGVDADRVSALMEEKKDSYQKELEEDNKEGAKFGVNGTPSVVIGEQMIVGAQPLATFTQVIDALLEK